MSTGGAVRHLRARLQQGPPPWLPGVATLLIALGCTALGRTTPTVGMAIAGALFIAAMLAPPLGIVALVAGAMASPLAVSTGTHTDMSFPMLAVPVLAVAWFAGAVWRRDLGALRLPAVRAVCALALIAALASWVGNLPWFGFSQTAPVAAQLGGLAVFVLSAATVVLAAD